MIPGRASETAQVVCLIRALDAAWRGDDSLIRDVYAERFLSGPYRAAYRASANPAGRAAMLPMRWLYNWAVLRHAFIDELVREAGPRMPVVLLGAGYDSRAWRLRDHLGNGIYEIDFASTQDRKRSLAEKAGLEQSVARLVEADFASEPLDVILERTGLRGQPALIIWEGVTMYLREPVIRSTLRAVGEFFGQDSALVADFWISAYDRVRRKLPATPLSDLWVMLLAEPFLFGTSPNEVRTLAGEEGVPDTSVHTDPEIALQFGVTRSLMRSPYFMGVFRY